jgi:microcystin-dependent protein
MTIDPRDFVTNDKRIPTQMAGDQGKALVVNQTEDAYIHSAQVTITDITGQIIMWPTNTPPDGYLLCDGAQYAYDDYPALGFILGASAGGNFNVPDIVFAKNSKGVNTLTQEAEGVGTHNHSSVAAGGHSHSITVNSVGGHTHTSGSAGSHSHGMDSGGSHSHTYRSSLNQPAEPATGSGARVANDNWPTYNTSTAGSHTHGIHSGGGHTHTGGSGGAHGHTGTANSVGDHDHNIQNHVGTTQPACTLINFLIKT